MKHVYGRRVLANQDICPGDFEYMLAVTPDTLVVIDRDLEPIEFIIRGINTKAIVFCFEKDDDFLDAINICKRCVGYGIYPVNSLYLNC